MLQPLTHYLRVPIITEMVEAYGPYLEKLTKDEKYCLIGCLALWQQRVAEDEYTEYGYEQTNAIEGLIEEYPVASVVEALLRQQVMQLNEPQILRLLGVISAQLQEGYYRKRKPGEYDKLGNYGDPFCSLPGADSDKEFPMLDSEDFEKEHDFDETDAN
jgi:hypothetical protein